MYLDKLVETVGGEPSRTTTRRSPAAAARSPSPSRKRAQKQIRDIVESAYDHGADMIVTPCPLCQANVEIYQSEINKKQGTKFNMPVVYYSQLMTVAYGGSAKDAGLDGQMIPAPQLEQRAAAPAASRRAT